MCGIVGLASQSPTPNPDLLTVMRDTMRHRGPDDAGTWYSPDECVGLAQRRLAIIDLSPGGHQPMSDSNGQLWITFNGEIYNYQELHGELEARGHRFRTASDTEVILEAYRAWGTDCLVHLNGMFAFGLYDSNARQLFLARDRAGEKPLFYWHTPGQLILASELKAILAHPALPRQLDLEALEFYLAYGYVPGDKCILRGVHKLPQSHAAIYALDTDTLRVWRYWRLPDPPSLDAHASADELTDELESLLEDAVRRQLIADVPVGILLSGGIDSSLVTAMAARVSSTPVKTFTISFPGYDNYDEGPYARLVAQHFGTQHTELVAEPVSVELLPTLARQYDEPLVDSSMVPTYLVSRLIRQHATVALGGDGGDELFGGYPHYAWFQRYEVMRPWLINPLRAWGRALVERLPVGFRGRNYLLRLTARDLQEGLAAPGHFDSRARRQLLATQLNQDTFPPPETYKLALSSDRCTAVQAATALDFMTYLVEDILVKVDRASMLNSLEVRAPWLDYRIIEFAFGRVPDSLRATQTERKILPRRLAQRLLPPALDLKRKQGFSLPLNQWFKGDWGAYMEAVLQEADPHLFNRRMIQRLIDNQRRGYVNNTERLFALTLFELWRREYHVALPSA